MYWIQGKRLFSQEHREKLSKAKLGMIMPKESVEKMKSALKNKKRTQETKIAISKSKLGSKNPQSILSEENVLEIKKLLLNKILNIVCIANSYGVSPRTIRDIKNLKTWTHI